MTLNCMAVVLCLLSPPSAKIGSREKYCCPFAYSRIILIIVAAGSGWICGSHSVAVSIVEIVSPETLNPVSRTLDMTAARWNSLIRPLISSEGLRAFDLRILVMMMLLSVLIV